MWVVKDEPSLLRQLVFVYSALLVAFIGTSYVNGNQNIQK